MERKNYLVEKLSKEENLYLKRIVQSARNKYIIKNQEHINNYDFDINVTDIPSQDSVIDVVLEKCEKKVKSAMDFEFVLSNPKLNKIIGALSLNERKVLFYLFWEKKTINNVSYRNWNKSAYKFDKNKKAYILKKEIKAGYDVPKKIIWKWNNFGIFFVSFNIN